MSPFLCHLELAKGSSFEFPVADRNLKNEAAGALRVSRLLISVADVQLVANKNSKGPFKIVLNEAAEQFYQVIQEGELIRVRLKEGVAVTDSRKKQIEVIGASIPIEIHANSGDINIQDWSAESLVHLQKGRIKILRNRGDISVHSLAGEVDVQQQVGRLDIDTFKSNILIKDYQGDLDVRSFLGDVLVENGRGVLSFVQGSGNLKVLKGNGALQFELTKGSLGVQQFSGRVEGSTQDGNVGIQMAEESDISVKSQSGKVIVTAPKSASSIFLNLMTQEGEIVGPPYMGITKDGAQKVLKGRTKGEGQKGSVFVRSSEGSIQIR